MPWCDDCSKFWNPPQLSAGGRCPSCGTELGAPAGTPAKASTAQAVAVPPRLPEGVLGAGTAGAGTATRPKGAPWHFKLLVVGVTVYMVYRIYWLVEWLPKHV